MYLFDESEQVVCSNSGGETSAMMTYKLLEANGGEIPPNVHIIFANTGAEYPETLDFLKKQQEVWGIDITWLEYRYYPDRKGGRSAPKHDVITVDYETASRNHEPFEQLIDAKQYLPNIAHRICTTQLKVMTIDRYMRRHLGVTKYLSMIGIIRDEPKRFARMTSNKENIKRGGVHLPLFYEGVRVSDVKEFWSRQNFSLECESNCIYCFQKGRAQMHRNIRRDPNSMDWWIRQEQKFGEETSSRVFIKDITYESIRRDALERTVMDVLDGVKYGVDCYCGD